MMDVDKFREQYIYSDKIDLAPKVHKADTLPDGWVLVLDSLTSEDASFIKGGILEEVKPKEGQASIPLHLYIRDLERLLQLGETVADLTTKKRLESKMWGIGSVKYLEDLCLRRFNSTDLINLMKNEPKINTFSNEDYYL